MGGLEVSDATDKLARHMGIESFKASDGWLWCFCNHHRIGILNAEILMLRYVGLHVTLLWSILLLLTRVSHLGEFDPSLPDNQL